MTAYSIGFLNRPRVIWNVRPVSERDPLDIAPEEVAVAALIILDEQDSSYSPLNSLIWRTMLSASSIEGR